MESVAQPAATTVSDARRQESSVGFQGWRVVLAAHFGVMLSFGSLLVFTFGVFLKPLAADFGWSREAISRAFAIGAITVAVCSPFLGRLLDHYGSRRIVLPCIVVFGTAFGSLALLTPRLWHLYAVFVVLGIVGNGTTQMGYAGAISGWFTVRRGMALAFVMAGVGIGSMVLPVLAQWIIDHVGWRAAYAVLGALILLVAAPLSARFLRDRETASVEGLRVEASGVPMSAALRSRVFWIITITLFVNSVGANGALTHMAAMLTDRGLSTAEAALAASALGGAGLAGRLGTGWLLDRFFGPRIAMALLLVMASGIILLSTASTFPEGVAAAMLIGLGMGGESDVTPFLLARYFGLRSFSTLYGVTWTFYAFAGGVGPVLMGRAFDATGSYTRLMLLISVPMILSALLYLWMPRYRLNVE